LAELAVFNTVFLVIVNININYFKLLARGFLFKLDSLRDLSQVSYRALAKLF